MKFLEGKELQEKIYDTIYYADKYLIILSPYINLDKYFREQVFKTLQSNSSVHIIIGFGKNEDRVTKSFNKEDIEYFTNFPNITIVYLSDLHGKFYGNEKNSIVTSLNLLDYSFKNNIEFGAFASKKIITKNDFFHESQNKCFEILENGQTVFVKRPKYKKKFISFSKGDYVGSEIEVNLIDKIINGEKIEKIRFSDFVSEKYVNAELKESRKLREEIPERIDATPIKKPALNGYCISCRAPIKLDLKRPLCRSCFIDRINTKEQNKKYTYCISCGDKHHNIFEKPACYPCFKGIENTENLYV